MAKYPTLFQPADAILITKVDLVGVLDFNMESVRKDLSKINTRAPVMEISPKTGQGMDKWVDWLIAQRKGQE